MTVGVIGGKVQFKALKSTLSEKDYAIGKAHVWMKMINDMMKPKRWLKPNKNGTGIHFEGIKNQDEYDIALFEFEKYLNKLNEEYGTDFKLTKNEGNTP